MNKQIKSALTGQSYACMHTYPQAYIYACIPKLTYTYAHMNTLTYMHVGCELGRQAGRQAGKARPELRRRAAHEAIDPGHANIGAIDPGRANIGAIDPGRTNIGAEHIT